ncbi:MAG: SDR family NAD(P)-dependent oxidoreductase [Chitinophagaceae bacterium]|nr:SDR family NAD(P)-dependent oxidoreductase [Chitinophagaceae bacterium]
MKNILITGANGNLGVAAVKKFLDSGYRVIAVARSGSELGFAVGHSGFELHQVDLSDENASTLFMKEAIDLYGTIDGALFLAGGFAMGNIENTSGDDLKKMFSLNFETAYFIMRPLFTHMLQQGCGRMVFIGARAVLEAEQGKNSLAYILSKSLLFTLAEALNAAAKGKNVSASVVVPGIIDTPPNRKSMPGADFSKWPTPEQIAGVLEFICRDTDSPVRNTVFKVYGNS